MSPIKRHNRLFLLRLRFYLLLYRFLEHLISCYLGCGFIIVLSLLRFYLMRLRLFWLLLLLLLFLFLLLWLIHGRVVLLLLLVCISLRHHTRDVKHRNSLLLKAREVEPRCIIKEVRLVSLIALLRKFQVISNLHKLLVI